MTSRDFFEVVGKRRSIRAYTNDEVSNEDLMKIAEAGRSSPTSVNQQSRKFTVVKNKELITELAQAIGREIHDYEYDFYDPAAIILVSVPGAGQISAVEVGLAVQSMWLAAAALDLGMAWMHQINGLCDRKPVRKVLDKLGLPKHHICLSVMALGVPAETPGPKPRTEEINLVE
ncbi:nitroreductase family protein [Aerococcaceae bacterium DSM 111176]|nr:nitroreductase family protein [Aerococcaceae bacterium DSM 111176]